ncbi:MAG: ATP-binding protein [Pseudomonadota bacterium]
MQAETQVHAEEQSDPYAINRFTLLFRDRDLERRFSEETLANSIVVVRAAVFAGMLLYALFGILDLIVLDEGLETVLLIRYALVCPIVAGVLALSWTPFFFRHSQVSLSLAMFLPGVGIILMTIVLPPPFNSYYYAGLIMVVIYCASLIRIKFISALCQTVGLLLAYQLSSLVINPIPPSEIANNNFFLLMSVGVGCFSSYVQEYLIRRNFINQETILTDRKRIENLLKKADAANEAKSNFLAVVSHELRTPLNAVIGFSDVLLKETAGPLGAPEYKDYAGDINKSGQHLLSIINDILCLTKAEAGKLVLEMEPVYVPEVIDDALRMCQTLADERRVEIRTNCDIDTPMVIADERLLRQVFINLVHNAVKFTEGEGAVDVVCGATQDGFVRVTIEDNGVGIAEADLPRVVLPFEQADSARTRATQGTGLGLPFAKKITEAHDGDFDIESEVGTGTKITLTFKSDDMVEDDADHDDVTPLRAVG